MAEVSVLVEVIVSRIVHPFANAVVLALVAALFQFSPAAATAPASTAGPLSAIDMAARKPPKKKKFTPQQGVVFNNPLGGTAAHRINRKILNSIDAAPKGSVIRVMSWNIMSRGGVNTLLRAQRRGVKIKVLMAAENKTLIPNPFWATLVNGVRAGNVKRRQGRKSLTKLCKGSCRGAGGSAHAKFFLFSQSGRAKNVYIQGSANLTTAAATNQWNDIVTSTNEDEYRFARDTFEEMVLDQPVKNPFAVWTSPSARTVAGFLPLRGVGKFDPAASLLDQVKCRNADNTPNGRTVIRVAPDVMRHARGMAIARRLKFLWNSGCDVKLGYTVMGVQIFRLLRGPGARGPVPMRHLVQDFDGDGEFDRYFHLKAMSIIGHMGKNRSAYVVTNGSGNLSGSGAASDENFGIYWRKSYTQRYHKYIDYWWNNYPSSAAPRTAALRLATGPAAFAARQGVPGAAQVSIHTPDTLMTADEQLVEGVDPYAQMEQ